MEVPIYIMDFEGNAKYGIVEYGVVAIVGAQIKQCYTRICKPHADIDPRDVRLHGIQNLDTKGTLPFADDMEQFLQWRREGAFGAHNASVENGLLKSVSPYPSRCPNFLTGQQDQLWGPWVDTRRLFENLCPGRDRYKLGDLLAACDLQKSLDDLASKECPEIRSKAHCALYDALASALLLLWLCKEQPLSLQELLHYSQPAGKLQEGNQQELL